MFRWSMLAFVVTKLNFPGARLRLWLKHVPCDKHECDVCNPLIGTLNAMW